MKLSNRQKSQLFSIILLVVITCITIFQNWKNRASFNDFEQNANKKIYYTKHAKCRMDCRFISKEEINFIREKGNINYRKSDLKDQPCPTIAKEGRSKDGQMLRIVFAECANETKVVTAIDLENEYTCDCK